MHDVTIIIPAFVTTDESYEWLKECVASALRQDCQVVVYDDCSKLIPEKLMEDFDNVSNLRVFKGVVHKGVSYARNRAVEHANTSLILPLDCDDMLADEAVSKLLHVWNGTPVYPDLVKFGIQEVPHFRLLDFSCELLQKKLGISSVNVLHAVEQWRAIGGWNEHLDLYEDAEYNARLMLLYCGMNVHEPLVRYRQHAAQRTRSIKDTSISVDISRDILNSLRRLQVGCPSCGGKRRSSVEALAARNAAPSAAVAASSLPGEQDGRVLAFYTGGKGQGTHYYRGVSTKFAYKVVYGNYYYVDPMDATSSATPNRRSMFVQVEKPKELAKVEAQKLEEITIARTPVVDVVRTPVLDEEAPVREAIPDLPDIAKLTYGDISELDLSEEEARILLSREESGRNRSGVKDFLKKYFGG